MEQGLPESTAAAGINESWQILRGRAPEAVQAAALVNYDPRSGTYWVPCLGQDIAVQVPDRTLHSDSDLGRMLLHRYPEYAKLSILRYLAHAENRALSGELIKPAQLPGGNFFVVGTHVLPLPALAHRFDGHGPEFIRRGKALGGEATDHGDVSLELFPFPRIPVQIILWFSDEEFPPQATLLVDSNCREHMAVDVLWSTCMLTLYMLQDAG
ncbi:MAG: DUF3786 domain-containing protein [Desulfurivibrio sp.]|nr:DUF3786 domain-containing protein [Desulfurivibrio sp.]